MYFADNNLNVVYHTLILIAIADLDTIIHSFYKTFMLSNISYEFKLGHKKQLIANQSSTLQLIVEFWKTIIDLVAEKTKYCGTT
jgi:hypothetical protein